MSVTLDEFKSIAESYTQFLKESLTCPPEFTPSAKAARMTLSNTLIDYENRQLEGLVEVKEILTEIHAIEEDMGL